MQTGGNDLQTIWLRATHKQGCRTGHSANGPLPPGNTDDYARRVGVRSPTLQAKLPCRGAGTLLKLQ